MKKIASLIEQFNVSIREIEKNHIDELSELDKKIKLSNKYLQECRIVVRNEGFTSQKDEIHFFKVQKPLLQGYLEYFQRRRNFNLEFPLIPIKVQGKFLCNAISLIEVENSTNLDFIKYYKSNKSALDHYFFLRGSDQLDLFLNSTYRYDDPDFSTNHDYLASKIVTNDLLQKFYNSQLDQLDKRKTNKQELAPPQKYIWTDTKTAFFELIKGLIAKGSINYGVVDMKELSEYCKDRLGVDLGNYNQIFSQIKSRKKDPTKFIDELKMTLQNLIDLENKEL